MGSLAAENEDSEREIHVLVTGFGVRCPVIRPKCDQPGLITRF